MPEVRWTLETVREGIEKFILDHNRPPTAVDFDTTPYLPSARHIQRVFGGLAALRAALGYELQDFTKGTARSAIATAAGVRGVEAEEALELVLMQRFGEPYVHSQKRYIRGGKSRYDFFIYAKDYSFGVDIFATERREYIEKNVRHKIRKYAETSQRIPIYFVLAGESFTSDDTEPVEYMMLRHTYPNIHLMTLADFLIFIDTLQPLARPAGIKSLL
jgi:hypothetical protein